MLDDALAHVHRAPFASQLVLRGSLLTEQWVPGRRANDIDFLVDGGWTPATLSPVVATLFADFAGVACEVGTIWGDTDFPGVRATLRRGDEAVQVDFGWGERLAAAPVPGVARGRTWRTVVPEVMFGWKAHSLVEHGPRGRWHAKTVADLVLFHRHVPLEPGLTRRAIALAFESQRLSLTLLDPVLDDPTWGGSRGSRNKWKSYQRKAPWVTFSLEEALREVRSALRPLVR